MQASSGYSRAAEYIAAKSREYGLEQVQVERLNRALGHYRMAIAAASPEDDKAILSRAHESMGRINAFLDNTAEAVKSFDEAIKIGDVRGGAYREALEGKKKLTQP